MGIDINKSICHVEITAINLMPRVWRGAETAKENGYDVSVIGFGDTTIYKGIKYEGVGFPKNRLDRILRLSRRMVKIASESNAKIVELHSPELLLYYKKLKRAKKRIIFNSHEFYAMQIKRREYIPKCIRGIVSRLYEIFEKIVCSKIDCIIFPCTVKGCNPFEKYKCKSIKIENFTTLEKVPEGKKEPRSAIYAGSLSEDRGCTAMVEAFNEIEGKLYLAGEFSSDEYKEYIINLANSDKITYLGSLSREEIFEYYSKTLVGINLLMKAGQYDDVDNLSTKIYEYMYCGMPVVSSDLRYAKLVNQEYEYGIIVNPNSQEEILKALERLFNDSDYALKLGINGKKAISEKFNWGLEKTKLVDLYNEICNV